MYLEIYPDIIFILNFFIDFILLFLLKKVNRKNSNWIRMFTASAVGALFAAIAGLFPWMNVVIRFLLLNVAAAVAMIYTAFGKMRGKELIKQIIVLYLITWFVGGLMNSLYYYTDIRGKVVHIGTLIFSNISWVFILIIMLSLIPSASFILWLHRLYQSERKETYEVELYYDNSCIHTKGLMDSGNCLYDPIFKKPVMVIENSMIRTLLPADAYIELENTRKWLEENQSGKELPGNNKGYLLHLRLIPYQSIGRARGMMVGLILDKVLIHTKNDIICNEKVTAAICDNHLSAKDDYHVILHKELI